MAARLGRWLQAVRPARTGPRRTFARANHVALRGLGVIYLVAIVSFWWQADGLIGARGILPFASWLESLRPQVEQVGYGRLPTLLWLHPGDAFLHVLFGAAAVFAVLLAAGWVPWLCTPVLWALYLSLAQAGQVFLGFQWDALLLEVGFLAILVSPWRVRLRWGQDPDPPRLAILLLHVLCFRFMLASGWVKLASQDPAWRDCTALAYHYWTQPLPSWTAWYMNLLPMPLQRASCAAMFAIEMGLPFLIWMPRRARHVAAFGFIALMLVVMATGNYAYFNLLTIVLCLWLLDDAFWRAPAGAAPARTARELVQRVLIVPPAAVVLVLSIVILAGTFRAPVPWPRWVGALYEAVQPFRSVNHYGLFAVMTKSRPEIVIEGSPDGEHWFAYEFAWKPGDPARRPRFVAPHQPRLDWQMWFAALGTREGNPWFLHLLVRLLQNEPAVLALLAHNPFPERPPQAVRAWVYEYRFTTAAERRATGAWWTRAPKAVYCPAIRLNTPPRDVP